jgi:hypothetical protein
VDYIATHTDNTPFQHLQKLESPDVRRFRPNEASCTVHLRRIADKAASNHREIL